VTNDFANDIKGILNSRQKKLKLLAVPKRFHRLQQMSPEGQTSFGALDWVAYLLFVSTLYEVREGRLSIGFKQTIEKLHKAYAPREFCFGNLHFNHNARSVL